MHSYSCFFITYFVFYCFSERIRNPRPGKTNDYFKPETLHILKLSTGYKTLPSSKHDGATNYAGKAATVQNPLFLQLQLQFIIREDTFYNISYPQLARAIRGG